MLFPVTFAFPDLILISALTHLQTLQISLPHCRKAIPHCLGNECGHPEIRVEVDTKVTNNGALGNSGHPQAERNLWNLELPTT